MKQAQPLRETAAKQGRVSPVARPRSLSLLPDNSVQTLAILKVTIACGLLTGFALSWKLWVSSRLFPLSPVTNVLPSVPYPLDYIWFCSLLALLIAVIISGKPSRFSLAFMTTAVLLSLWDQTRWQPWFYQYLFMLAAVSYAWTKPNPQRQAVAINVCRLILICTYFWSGLQKLNANFVAQTWPDLTGSLPRLLLGPLRRLPPSFTFIVPVLEILIGMALLGARFRKIAVTLAIGTHVFVLILLIASGENVVVWPWNLAMIVFVAVLFGKPVKAGARDVVYPRSRLHAVTLTLFGILPALNFLGLWDSYLSCALYSGNTYQAVIYVSPAVINQLPAPIHPHIWRSTQPFFLDINRWSFGELNVPLYPEPRVYREVTRKICSYAGGSSDIRLRIQDKPDLFTAIRKSEYYDCDHLDSNE